MNPLSTYVGAWRQSTAATLELCESLTAEQWMLPTDCPGWTVRDVIAHNAHLEHVLLTGDDLDATALTGVVSSQYTTLGVEARRQRSTNELVEEFGAAVESRSAALQTLPADPQAIPAVTPGNIGWDWDTLLRNRALDIWVHEQDIRRAINRPGGMDSGGASIATMTFGFGMPFVLGKKVKAPPGSTFVWQVTGEVPLHVTAAVGDDGRASRLDSAPADPTAVVTMSTEAFTVLCAGRRRPDAYPIKIEGDFTLADAVLANMSVTP